MNTRFKDIGIYSGSVRPAGQVFIKSGYQALLFALLNDSMNIYWCQLNGGITMQIFPVEINANDLFSYEVSSNIAIFTNMQGRSNVRYVYITTPT